MIKWKQENEIEMMNQNLTAVSITDSEQIEVYSRSDVNTDSLTGNFSDFTNLGLHLWILWQRIPLSQKAQDI